MVLKLKTVSSNQTSKGYGLVNKLINKLPFELHIPSYNYCGPGTKLTERLTRGDKGINQLDDACKTHDIAYHNFKDLTKRHEADKVLEQKAIQRLKSKEASFGEKAAALGITAIMKLKRKVGMGKKPKEGMIPFLKAVEIARKRLQAKKPTSSLSASKIAISALKPYKGRIKKPSRIIPMPNRIGGFIFTIPAILAAIGAIGSLAGGASSIAKSVNEAKAAKAELEEKKRHNMAMEPITIGKGLSLRQHKKGYGFYLKPYESKNC